VKLGDRGRGLGPGHRQRTELCEKQKDGVNRKGIKATKRD